MAITAKLVKELREKTGAGMMDCKKALVETDGDVEKAVNWLREKGISKAEKKQSRIAAEGLCEVVENQNVAYVYEVNSETDFAAKNSAFLALVENIGKALIASKPNDINAAKDAAFDGKTITEMLTESTLTIGEKIELRRLFKLEKKDGQIFGTYKHMGGKIVSCVVLDGDNAEVARDVAMHVAAINPQFVNDASIPEEVLAKEKEVQIQKALNEGKPEKIVHKMVIGRMNKFKKEICLVDQPFVKDQDITVGKYVASKKMQVIDFARLEVGEGVEKRQEDFAAEVAAQIE